MQLNTGSGETNTLLPLFDLPCNYKGERTDNREIVQHRKSMAVSITTCNVTKTVEESTVSDML